MLKITSEVPREEGELFYYWNDVLPCHLAGMGGGQAAAAFFTTTLPEPDGLLLGLNAFCRCGGRGSLIRGGFFLWRSRAGVHIQPSQEYAAE